MTLRVRRLGRSDAARVTEERLSGAPKFTDEVLHVPWTMRWTMPVKRASDIIGHDRPGLPAAD